MGTAGAGEGAHTTCAGWPKQRKQEEEQQESSQGGKGGQTLRLSDFSFFSGRNGKALEAFR